jgi:hypothetical protein
MDQAGTLFEAAAGKLATTHFRRRAIVSQLYQGRPGCTYCGFCEAFGCHVSAKVVDPGHELPEADATGNFRLLTRRHVIPREKRQPPRLTYDWRRPNELKRVEFVTQKLEELGRAAGATHVAFAPRLWCPPGRAPRGRNAHGE